MTCLEELGDLTDEVIGDEKPGNRKTQKGLSQQNLKREMGNRIRRWCTGNGKQNSPPSNKGNGSQKDAKRVV